jgi:hypothetical protein
MGTVENKIDNYLNEASDMMVAQNPNDKLWYVVGNTGKVKGKTYYMPISNGYRDKKEAEKQMAHQKLADKDAKNIVKNWNI